MFYDVTDSFRELILDRNETFGMPFVKLKQRADHKNVGNADKNIANESCFREESIKLCKLPSKTSKLNQTSWLILRLYTKLFLAI
jgi:hypothetical protein